MGEESELIKASNSLLQKNVASWGDFFNDTPTLVSPHQPLLTGSQSIPSNQSIHSSHQKSSGETFPPADRSRTWAAQLHPAFSYLVCRGILSFTLKYSPRGLSCILYLLIHLLRMLRRKEIIMHEGVCWYQPSCFTHPFFSSRHVRLPLLLCTLYGTPY